MPELKQGQEGTPTWAEENKLGDGQYKYDDVDKRWMFVKPDSRTFIIDTDTQKPIEGMKYIPSIYERLGQTPVPVGQQAQTQLDIAPPADMGVTARAPTAPMSSLPPPPPPPPAKGAKDIKKKGLGSKAKKGSPLTEFNAPEEVVYGQRPQ